MFYFSNVVLIKQVSCRRRIVVYKIIFLSKYSKLSKVDNNIVFVGVDRKHQKQVFNFSSEIIDDDLCHCTNNLLTYIR